MSKPTNNLPPWGTAAHTVSARHGALLPAAASSAVAAAAAPVLTAAQQTELAAAFDATLRAGMHGLCFSPYLDGQGPGSQIGEAQIRERLQIIRPHTRWVRSFSCIEGNELIPRIAHECGLKTLVGAWFGTDRDIN